MRYSSAWRTARKVMTGALNASAVERLVPLQEAESAQTMKELCETPELFDQHVRRYATSVILASVFGKRGLSWDDPDVSRIYGVQDAFTEVIEPGNIPPVDEIPALNWLPAFIATWKTRAAKARKGQYDLYTELLTATKRRMEKGVLANCFMTQILSKSEREKHQLNEDRLAYVGGNLLEAGSDTTSSIILGFILLMLKYPKVYKKAQQEVDAVCGGGQSPTLQDAARLPYMKACINEVCHIPGSVSPLQAC
jgi:cytochrome P450 family 619